MGDKSRSDDKADHSAQQSPSESGASTPALEFVAAAGLRQRLKTLTDDVAKGVEDLAMKIVPNGQGKFKVSWNVERRENGDLKGIVVDAITPTCPLQRYARCSAHARRVFNQGGGGRTRTRQRREE